MLLLSLSSGGYKSSQKDRLKVADIIHMEHIGYVLVEFLNYQSRNRSHPQYA